MLNSVSNWRNLKHLNINFPIYFLCVSLCSWCVLSTFFKTKNESIYTSRNHLLNASLCNLDSGCFQVVKICSYLNKRNVIFFIIYLSCLHKNVVFLRCFNNGKNPEDIGSLVRDFFSKSAFISSIHSASMVSAHLLNFEMTQLHLLNVSNCVRQSGIAVQSLNIRQFLEWPCLTEKSKKNHGK